MNKKRIKELLAQLREEVRDTDVDDDLKQLMGKLDDDIRGAIDDNADLDAVIDRAKELEANFATNHPTAERVVREVIDLLVRIGI